MPPTFLPGVELCGLFHAEVVGPLLAAHAPGVPYAAALVGPGSDVFGFDTPRSTDHDWGPRLQLFLRQDDVTAHGSAITGALADHLPTTYRGWATRFEPAGPVWVPAAGGRPVTHRVEVTSVADWCSARLGVDPRTGLAALDWLSIPAQRLAEATAGAVYRDDTGELTAVRAALRWYPDDVWRHLLACQWTRIAQEEAFVGRAAEAGDELGSRVVAARLARDVMRLCLLLARRYPVYSKWLGTAFGRLPDIGAIAAALAEAVATSDGVARQAALCTAYEAAGGWQNRLRLADPVECMRRPFFDRPYPVVGAGRFAAALRSAVADPQLAALPPYGGVDQYVDSTDVLGELSAAHRITLAASSTGSSPRR